MKAVTVKDLNNELSLLNNKELRELCLRLAKFKKENKEFLSYLLFESSDEESYVESIKREIDLQFEHINRKSNYLIKKNVRKILLNTRKFIRYTPRKKTEIDLLIYFCAKLKEISPSINKNRVLLNLYSRQIEAIRKKLTLLHEDLQYDYEIVLNELKD
jgi:hypothetical protein